MASQENKSARLEAGTLTLELPPVPWTRCLWAGPAAQTSGSTGPVPDIPPEHGAPGSGFCGPCR